MVLLLAAGSSETFACTCGTGGPVTTPREIYIGALNYASAVFRGTVIGHEYRKGILKESMEAKKLNDPGFSYETMVTKFQVVEWWKTTSAPTIYIISNSTKNSDGTETFAGCDYRFAKGETYLVFADGAADALQVSECSKTMNTKVSWFSDVYEFIGPGKEPIRPVGN